MSPYSDTARSIVQLYPDPARAGGSSLRRGSHEGEKISIYLTSTISIPSISTYLNKVLRARFIQYVVHCTVGIYGGWGSTTFAIRVPCLTSSDDFRSFKICNGTQDNILFIIRFSFDSAKVKRRNHGPEKPLFTFFCHLHFTADCLILFVFKSWRWLLFSLWWLFIKFTQHFNTDEAVDTDVFPPEDSAFYQTQVTKAKKFCCQF